jgi:hypothetical protein
MLEPATREFLEKEIDEAKTFIPHLLMQARETAKEMHIQNSEDYTLGLAIGYITGRFIALFSILYRRAPDREELKEATGVMSNRRDELRKAISKTGYPGAATT